MASSDARPVARKNVAFRCVFPLLDADGDLVTGASGLDSEVSKDQGAFADCTNEATEIATSSGVYYLDLTSTEMNADCVAIIVKTSTVGAKTTVLVFYPEEAGDYRADVTHYGGTAGTFSAGRPEVNTTHAAGTAWGSGAITAASIAADAITAAKVAADVTTEIQSGLATAANLATLQTSVDTIDNFLDTEVAAILADTNELQTDWADGGRLDLILDARASQTSVNTIDDLLDTEIPALTTAVADLPTNAELATALGTADDAVLAQVALVKAVTDALPDAGALTSLATAANLATVDTVVDAVKAKTDSLTFTTAGLVDANVQQINNVTITGDGQVGTEFGV